MALKRVATRMPEHRDYTAALGVKLSSTRREKDPIVKFPRKAGNPPASPGVFLRQECVRAASVRNGLDNRFLSGEWEH